MPGGAAGAGGSRRDRGAIPVVAHDGDLRTSSAQQRLLFIEDFMPGTALHNVPIALRLVGRLDVGALDAALTGIVQRHEVLRTNYALVEGQYVQRIAPAGPVAVTVVDLRDVEPDAGAAVLDREMRSEAARPFDLSSDLTVRGRLFRTADDAHVLVLTMHHIASDGWSVARLADELVEIYTADVHGRAPQLPELPIQYADYAAWHRAAWEDDDGSEGMAYWTGILAGELPILDLPTDHPRPPVQSYRGGEVRFEFDAELMAAVTAFSRRAGVTPFVTLIASYAAVLARFSGQDEVVIGTASANRGPRETTNLIGLFVNTLPIRIRIDRGASFAALVEEVRRQWLGALAHQDVPFERVVEAVRPTRDVSRAPIFQTMFVFQNMALPDLRLPGIVVEPLSITTGAYHLDLGVQLVPGPAGVSGSVEFNADVFVVGSVERLVGAWGVLLAAGVGDGSLGVGVLPLVAGGDRELLLSGGGLGGVVVPGWLRVDEWFASVVGSCGGAVAVSCGGEVLSYEGLDVLSNRLARVLVGLGVGPGSCVGVAVERSVGMVVALLGVLKAGAAYVPLDPGFPGERLAFMVADSGVGVVVTSGVVAAGVFDGSLFDVSGLRFVDLDRDAGVIGGMDGSSLGVVGGEVAYVIYTSGSTGVPKGVVVGHRGVINFLASMQVEPGLSVGDVLVAVTTLSFDISVLEVFLPLVSGASVVVAPGEVVGDGRLLAGLIESSGASVVQATPTTWSMLLESGWVGSPGLKVLCGGEAMSRGLADRLVGCCGSVWNMFGPTETTIWSTVFEVSPGGVGLVPIGRPIANTVCRVLDSAGELVPVGVPGELFIGGAGVALGYLGRDELTAERFVPDRFGSGGRLYRTGDLVRWRGDRCLEFLGRLDHQVKVRGYRIELGEVESVLRACPGVVEAVVVADGVAASARLVAYLTVLDGAGGVDVGMLREWVGSRLPGYMVPSVFITLDHFPMTPNRKIDRNALPAVGGVEQVGVVGYVAPRDEFEATIAAIWADVLGVERVGDVRRLLRTRRSFAARHPVGGAGS